MSRSNNDLLEFGPFILNKAERLLVRDGTPIQLTLKAFDTLVVLVESSGHVVNKDELMRKVWPDTFIGENTLASNISSLRKAMGAEGQLIETVPKIGYRFAGPVTRIAPPGDEPTREATAPSATTASAELLSSVQAAQAQSSARTPEPIADPVGASVIKVTGADAANESPTVASPQRRTIALKATAFAGLAL